MLSKQGREGSRFAIALSPRGIEVRRPGRPAQLMSWSRVSQWEIEECEGYVLLTLRGSGAATPLVVPGWSLEDLELVMRDVTSDPGDYVADGSGTGLLVTERNGKTAPPTAAAATPPATPPAAPPPSAPAARAVPAPATTPPATPTPPAPSVEAAPVLPRAERRRQRRLWRRPQLSWKPVVMVVLLGALAAAVTLVLLQSAGVINWSFLGPVA